MKVASRCMFLILVLIFLITAVSGGYADGKSFEKYPEPVTLTTVCVKDVSVEFDATDPEKRDYDINRWTNTFSRELNLELKHLWIAEDSISNRAKWTAAIAGGQLPDIAEVDDDIYQMLCEAGLCADMTDILAEYGSPELIRSITEDDYTRMSNNGRLYGLPIPTVALHGGSILFIRQDWLEQLDLDVPKTIEDVIEVAKQFQKAKLGGSDTVGILFAADGLEGDGRWDGFMNGFGAYLNYWIEKDGKLVWSNTLPEFRNALNTMQMLYAEGIINADIAVANPEVCADYIISGKTGLFYATAWNTTLSIRMLKEQNASAKIRNLLPVCEENRLYPLQTNSPACRRLFVSINCEHPEAAVKIANLAIQKVNEDYDSYGVDQNGFMWFKYLPWRDIILETTHDLNTSNAIRMAEENGDLSGLDDAVRVNTYQSWKLSKEGKSDPWWTATYGPGDAVYTLLYDAWKDDRLLVNAYNGLPTKTQGLIGGTINGKLTQAMLRVIMGENISIYDQAVEDWYANGGQAITEEVNEWYKNH